MSAPGDQPGGQDLIFHQLPPEFAELLQQIPACPELSEDLAQDRLFPSPGDVDDGMLAEDWKGLIEPDLQSQFLADRLTVATDLTRMKEGPQGWTLKIPPGHVDAWISALNQVRLAIAAAHHLGEAEMALEDLPTQNPELARTLQRVHFYGLLLEMLVQAAENNPPPVAAVPQEDEGFEADADDDDDDDDEDADDEFDEDFEDFDPEDMEDMDEDDADDEEDDEEDDDEEDEGDEDLLS